MEILRFVSFEGGFFLFYFFSPDIHKPSLDTEYKKQHHMPLSTWKINNPFREEKGSLHMIALVRFGAAGGAVELHTKKG